MQCGVGSSGRRKGGLCASNSASWVCWAGFEDLRPKAASPRGSPREDYGSLFPLLLVFYTSTLTPLYWLRPFNGNRKHHTVKCGRPLNANRRDVGQQAIHQAAITSLGFSWYSKCLLDGNLLNRLSCALKTWFIIINHWNVNMEHFPTLDN